MNLPVQMPNYISIIASGLAFALIDAAIVYFEALPTAAATPAAAAAVGIILIALRALQPAPDEVAGHGQGGREIPAGAAGAPMAMGVRPLTHRRSKLSGWCFPPD